MLSWALLGTKLTGLKCPEGARGRLEPHSLGGLSVKGGLPTSCRPPLAAAAQRVGSCLSQTGLGRRGRATGPRALPSGSEGAGRQAGHKAGALLRLRDLSPGKDSGAGPKVQCGENQCPSVDGTETLQLPPANTARAPPNPKLQGADSRTDSRMMQPVVPHAPPVQPQSSDRSNCGASSLHQLLVFLLLTRTRVGSCGRSPLCAALPRVLEAVCPPGGAGPWRPHARCVRTDDHGVACSPVARSCRRAPYGRPPLLLFAKFPRVAVLGCGQVRPN